MRFSGPALRPRVHLTSAPPLPSPPPSLTRPPNAAAQPAGQAVPKGIHPSNVEITKLKIDKDRKELIKKKAKGKEARAARFAGAA